ncbi:MAG: hypothetical protein WEF86_16205 [Gemmatimonadota bacterium]
MKARIHRMQSQLVCALIIAPVLLPGCSSKQRLGEYDYRNRSLAVVSMAPAYPEVLGGAAFHVDTDRPLTSLLRVGSEIAREVQKHQVRPRLDSAAVAVDVETRMSASLLDNAARHLRAVPTTDGRAADYELEVRIHRYGIVASAWTAPAYFLIDADMTLLDGSTGRRIWRGRVQERDAVRPYAVVGDRAVSSTVSAIALANMSVDDISRQLENLADYAANSMSVYFVRSLDDARQ